MKSHMNMIMLNVYVIINALSFSREFVIPIGVLIGDLII